MLPPLHLLPVDDARERPRRVLAPLNSLRQPPVGPRGERAGAARQGRQGRLRPFYDAQAQPTATQAEFEWLQHWVRLRRELLLTINNGKEADATVRLLSQILHHELLGPLAEQNDRSDAWVREALAVAAVRGTPDHVRAMLQYQGRVRPFFVREALLRAVEAGRADNVGVFFEDFAATSGAFADAGSDVPWRVNASTFALPVAAESGQPEALRVLLQKGADVHDGNERAMRAAVVNGHAKVVALLLEYGANRHGGPSVQDADPQRERSRAQIRAGEWGQESAWA